MTAAARASTTRTAAPAAARSSVMRRNAPRTGYAPSPLASLSAIPAAVQRKCSACEREERMPVQPRLEVGPAGDRYEQEADSIATRVMAMREGDASPAGPTVQRACAACSAEDDKVHALRDEDDDTTTDEVSVRARRNDGPETIAASDTQLSSGGAPLPAQTRGFFEDRMGRDLGDVRIHQGGGSEALNAQIAARAFTYRNHIWLGADERAGPSFTMAHELAHVMQQTAPGPVGPADTVQREATRAQAADATVQRRGAPFWLPVGVGTGLDTLTQHTAMHNAALDAVRTKNPGILTEVPIPGGNRKSVGPGVCGFADLYTTTGSDAAKNVRVPGVEVVDKPAPVTAAPAATTTPEETTTPAAPTTPAAAPAASISDLRNFTLRDSLTSCKDRIGTAMQPGGSSAHGSQRAPKIDDAGKLTEISFAPTGVRIGEMKPAHNLDYRDSGKKQIDNYIAGITATAARTNEVAAVTGVNATWTPGATDIGGMLTIPDGWDASGKLVTDWPIKSIKIRSYVPTKRKITSGPKAGTTHKGIKAKDNKQGRPKSQPIRGRWMMAADTAPARSGVFVYFLAPNPDDLKAAMATPSTRTDFRSLAGKIDAVQKDLIASPKPAKITGTVQPLPLVASTASPLRRPTPMATAALPRVTRTEVKEPFKAAQWEAKRTGAGLKAGAKDESLLGAYTDTASNELREEIADLGAMAEWIKAKPATGSVTYDDTPGNAELATDLDLLKKVDFWSGAKARPFGILREKFGGFFFTAFKKVSEFGERIKAKFKEKDENGMLGKGPKGTIMKAAAKVATVVLPRIAKPFLKAMWNTIVDCGVKGFEAKFRELTEGTVIDDVMETADAIRDKVNSIAADAEAYLKKLVDDTVGPIKKEFDDFIEAGKMVMEVAEIIAQLAKAARIGSCVAGLIAAPETVGIGAVVGCGAALADYILSIFGLSPVEYFIAQTLQSCEVQNKIGTALSAVQFVKTLPQRAGFAVVTKVKDMLRDSGLPGEFAGKSMGLHASELFCEPASMTFPEMPYETTDCSDTGNYKGSKTGTYDIPDSVKLYEKTDPIPDVEKPWMGVEIPAGRATPTAPTPPATAETPPPASSGGGADDAGGDAARERVHGVKPGSLSGKLKPVNVNYYVHGIGGGFAEKDYGGKLMTVKITAIDSSGVFYGPDTVEIEVYKVYPHPTKAGAYKIEFQPKVDYVLTSDSTSLGFVRKMRTGQVGRRM